MKISSTAIETVSGTFVDVLVPTPEMIDACDIAWALSREPRFCGHTISALPYTVGQHSMKVADIVRDVFVPGEVREASLKYFKEAYKLSEINIFDVLKASPLTLESPALQLFALLHDASEAYLRDIPSPVKNLPGLKEAYEVVETRMMCAIHKKFGLDKMSPQERVVAEKLTHFADIYARTIEAYHLMPSRGIPYSTLEISISKLQQFQEPQPSLQVYEDFLNYLNGLVL